MQDHLEKVHGDKDMVLEIVELKRKMKITENKSDYKKQI